MIRPRLWPSLAKVRLQVPGRGLRPLLGVVSGCVAVFCLLVVAARGDEKHEQKGALVICGGGDLPAAVRDRFVALAGGPKANIVVIPTASEYADAKGPELQEFLDDWNKQGVARVSLLHTRSRQQADAAAFADPINQATAVWFSGGDQSRVTEVYLGTAVEKALRALLARGGVIGGTSAGAAIMSRVMITGGQEKASVGTGFGFLPGVVVDQHALRRSRINRLVGVLTEHPELAGVAIDEGTALVVQNGRWHVMGKSYVAVCHLGSAGKPTRIDVYHDGDTGEVATWSGMARDRTED